jgi:RNA polymerase sigma-70 factor (ECF subfamily)
MQKSRVQIYDELLVLKCRQSDREAFDELVGRWQKRLWRYAYRVTGTEPAAWDIIQETWFAIIKGIRRLNDVAVFPCWAFRIVNNKCSDWLRKEQLQSRLNDHLAEHAPEGRDDRQDTADATESLQEAVRRLSPARRALLELRYHEGFDISVIAEILAIPEGTVKSRLNRTLEQLKRLVERSQNG